MECKYCKLKAPTACKDWEEFFKCVMRPNLDDYADTFTVNSSDKDGDISSSVQSSLDKGRKSPVTANNLPKRWYDH